MSKVLERKGASVNCGFVRSGRFDVKLTFCGNGVENHILELTMKLSMRKLSLISGWTPEQKRLLPDAKEREWNDSEWSEFQRKFMLCCKVWHRRFCLIPPASESAFSFSQGFFGPKYMPNVECHFKAELLNQAGDHHFQIDVTKVNTSPEIGEANSGISGTALDSSQVDPGTYLVKGEKVMQFAAAHEIGHLLGQAHIGNLKNTPECKNAIELNLQSAPADGSIPQYLIGGQNASACYGRIGNATDINVAANIMGVGMRFDEVNAISWRNALAVVNYGKTSLPDTWKTAVESYKGPRQL